MVRVVEVVMVVVEGAMYVLQKGEAEPLLRRSARRQLSALQSARGKRVEERDVGITVGRRMRSDRIMAGMCIGDGLDGRTLGVGDIALLVRGPW